MTVHIEHCMLKKRVQEAVLSMFLNTYHTPGVYVAWRRIEQDLQTPIASLGKKPPAEGEKKIYTHLELQYIRT